MKDINKKLSWNIERIDTELSIPMRCHYVYKFSANQLLESIDKFMDIDHNQIKQSVIDSLVSEFRITLNNVVFGEPAGREYTEYLEQEKKKNIPPPPQSPPDRFLREGCEPPKPKNWKND